MRTRFRKRLPSDEYLRVIFAVVLTAALMTAAPAIGHGVQHALFAHDSEKVDGKSAVGAGAGAERRAGKLVATNKKGQLPEGIVPADADNVMHVSGPLPKSETFRSRGGDYLLMASGSAYRPNSATTVGPIRVHVNVQDGSTILEQFSLQILANEKNSHKTLIPLFKTMALPRGPIEIELDAFSSFTCGTPQESSVSACTTTDHNDSFMVTLFDLP